MRRLDEIEARVPISSVPFRVTRGGAYYLTTNLTAGAGEDGIVVDAKDVTLDLNGFTLTGAGSSSGSGVLQTVGGHMRIYNGELRGWKGTLEGGIRALTRNNQVEDVRASECFYGIYLNGTGCWVQRCSVSDCDEDGFLAGSGSTVSACEATRNGRYGIWASDGCTVARCATYENGRDGIRADEGASVSDCVAKGNGEDGIDAGYGSAILDCTSAENGRHGIIAPYHSLIAGCTTYRNEADGIDANGYGTAVADCVSRLNDDDGIVVGFRSRVSGNACGDNGQSTVDGAGIQVSGNHSHIEGNTVENNDRGLVITVSGNVVARNVVRSNGDNYDIAAGNQLALLLCEVPETLDWPCSVRLAGALTCSEGGTNGITVSADDVTIDLNGHTLRGPGTASGHGIYQAATYRNLCIRNGTVVNWRGSFTSAVCAFGRHNRLEDLVAYGNRDGVLCGEQGSIVSCTARDNTDDGFYTWGYTTVSGCSAHHNGHQGMWVSDFVTVRGCRAHTNGVDGISANGFCRVIDSECIANGVSTNGAGIRVLGSGNHIDNNSVSRNTYGVHLGGSDGYNTVVRNVARGSREQNYVMGILNRTGPESGSLETTTSPYANFSFATPVNGPAPSGRR